MDDGGVQTAPAFSAQDSNREGTGHLCGLQKHHTLLSLEDAWSSLEEKRRDCPHYTFPPGPYLGETSETGWYFLEPFPLPLLLSSSMFKGER